jgi:CBS domain-containing protein
MKRSIRVEDLMSTAVIAVKASDALDLARDQMEVAGIRHLPVVDEHQQVVGILSNRDLLRAGPKGRVGEHMTTQVVTVLGSARAADAAARMQELKIGSLPVVGEDQRLVGIITETDFLGVAWRALCGLSLVEQP